MALGASGLHGNCQRIFSIILCRWYPFVLILSQSTHQTREHHDQGLFKSTSCLSCLIDFTFALPALNRAARHLFVCLTIQLAPQKAPRPLPDTNRPSYCAGLPLGLFKYHMSILTDPSPTCKMPTATTLFSHQYFSEPVSNSPCRWISPSSCPEPIVWM
jgi:hypothetical protein